MSEQKLRAEVERLWRENRRLEDENRALRTELASKADALEIAEKVIATCAHCGEQREVCPGGC